MMLADIFRSPRGRELCAFCVEHLLFNALPCASCCCCHQVSTLQQQVGRARKKLATPARTVAQKVKCIRGQNLHEIRHHLYKTINKRI